MTVLAGGVAYPLLAGAQQKAMPVVGYLHFASPESKSQFLDALRQGLAETGYVEGQNVVIEYRWAEAKYDRLPALAADLAARKVDVIVAVSGPSAHAAKSATSTIPIVVMTGGDPVADGLVNSLPRPGGNITGVSFLFIELHPKRLELLSDLLPHAKVIALLVNPNLSFTASVVRAVQEAAGAKGIELLILKAGTAGEIDAAFATLAERHADALLVGSDPFFDSRHEQLVTLASRYAIPAIYPWRIFADAGGLISYGPNLSAVERQLGNYAGRILTGEKPADLPVQQPTTFDLVVNLKTAKTLGLTMSPLILARADEVIE
jgi:putative tryptophan/tyrosine transport system substrate-binding protein